MIVDTRPSSAARQAACRQPHLHHLQQDVQPLLLQEHEAQLRAAGLLLGGQLAERDGDALLAAGLARLHDVQDLAQDAQPKLVLQAKAGRQAGAWWGW